MQIQGMLFYMNKIFIGKILSWRIILLILIFIGFFFLNYRSGYGFTNIFNKEYLSLSQIIYTLANFDGVHYLHVAQRGYISEGAFFPLYPMLIKIFSLGSENIYVLFWIGLIISNICLATSLWYFYKLLRLDYTEHIARNSLLFLVLFPTAFFLSAVYSESLFLMLLIITFYCIRKDKWKLAVIMATLLCATRLVGVFIIPVLLYEYWKRKGLKLNLLLLFFPAISDLLYAIYCKYKWGDFLYFLNAHGNLANGRETGKIILFPQTIYRYIKILINLPMVQFEWGIALFELSCFLFAILLLYIAWRKKIRLSYLIFSIPALLLPASSGTFSGLPRYVMIIFPMYIALALSGSVTLRRIYILIGVIFQFILLILFSRGYYVS